MQSEFIAVQIQNWNLDDDNGGLNLINSVFSVLSVVKKSVLVRSTNLQH